MRIAVVAVALTLATSGWAVDDVDGTLGRLKPDERSALIDLFDQNLFDGPAARFRSVNRVPQFENNFCGRINVKNKLGAYVGFKLFVADLGTKFIYIDNDSEPFGIEALRSRATRDCQA